MKHPLTSLLLVSTAIVAATAAIAQNTSELKPSVEVHLEALDSLGARAASAPQPTAAPVVAPVRNSAPERTVINQRAIIPLNQLNSRDSRIGVRKVINNDSRESRMETGGDLPRHRSAFSSRLQPLAPAPTAAGYAPPQRAPQQVVRIAPPYEASRFQQPQPAIAPKQEVVAPQPTAVPFEPAQSEMYQQPQYEQAAQPVDPVQQPEAAATEVVEPAPLEPERRIPINQTEGYAASAPAELETPVPSVANTAPANKESTTWWEDATDGIGEMFSSDEEAKEPAPQATDAANPDINVNEYSSEQNYAADAPLSVPPVLRESEPQVLEPAPEPYAQPQVSAPVQLTADESPVDSQAVENAASYDGLEMAEGFSGGLAAPSLALPPASFSQQAEVALPVPVVAEGEEVVLAQASEEGGEGLVDPFQDGSAFIPQPPVSQPIPEIIPESAPVNDEIAAQPVVEPETNENASNFVQAEAPASKEAAPVEAAAQDDSSWMGNLKDSLVGYFDDEQEQAKNTRPDARPPANNPVMQLKQDEMVAAPPPAEPQQPAPEPMPIQAEVEPAPAPEPMPIQAEVEPAPAPEPMPIQAEVEPAPAPEPVPIQAEIEPVPLPQLEIKAQQAESAPMSDAEIEKSMVALTPLQPMPDNPAIPSPAPVAAMEAADAAVASGLPSLTKLTGDPEVIREAQESRVASADIPPPLPSLERKPIGQPNEMPELPPAPELPQAEANDAEKLVQETASKLNQKESSAPVEQAPEVTVSAKAVPAEKPVETNAVPPPPPPPPALVAKAEEEPAPEAPKAVEAPEPKPLELAALPPKEKVDAAPKPSASFSLVFTGDDKNLPAGADSQLNSIADKLKSEDSARVNLKAFATDEDDAKAKRIALSRGLTVRNYLIDQGVTPLRINLLPMGNKSTGGSPERVDVELVTVGKI